MRKLLHSSLTQWLVLAFAAAGCDAGPSIRDCPPGTSCGIDSGTNFDVHSPDITPLDVRDFFTGLSSIEIRPADRVVVARGAPFTQDFTAVGRYADGTTRDLPLGTWTTTNPSLGTMNPDTGRLSLDGSRGGTTRVEVEVRRDAAVSFRAQTTFTVRVELEFFVGATPMTARDRFSGTLGTDAARRATLRYPLANAVMPENVAPPDVQWEGGAAGDLYRVSLVMPNVAVTGYVTHTGPTFRFDWPVDAAGWRALVSADLSAPVRVTVDHADAMGAVAGTSVDIQLKAGSLRGVIYYWDLCRGKILRIQNGSTTNEDFMPTPPRRADDGSRCVACHSVSRDGRYMSAEIWEGQGPGAVFDLTSDAALQRDPAPTRFAPSDAASWVYSSWNPDSTRLVANRLGGLFFVDPTTGARVPPTGGTLPADNAVQPAWSPDGASISYVGNVTGPGPTDFQTGDLATLPVMGTAVGASVTNVRGAQLAAQPEGGNAVAYPTWTPDSRWLAFQHGPNSQSVSPVRDSCTDTTPQRRFPAAAYLIARPTAAAPTPTPIRLTNASGGGAEADAYFPNFSPFIAGGQYWLVFFSRRDYGNAQAGTRGTGRRQLWVTAISTTPESGRDPSNVPYWLPGQDVRSDNVTGYWATQACSPRAAACQVDSDCCAGICVGNVCNPPPPSSACRREGERCSVTADCCTGTGLVCAGTVCLSPPP